MENKGYGLSYGYEKSKDKYIKCPYCKKIILIEPKESQEINKSLDKLRKLSGIK